jgi:hypothetical protein
MSPVSRSRKPKRPVKTAHRAPASPYSHVVEEAKALLDPETEVMDAELWGSFALGGLFEAAWREAEEHDEDPDELFERMFGELLDYLAKQKRRPEALAGLRALGMVGEEWSRREAVDAADWLAGEAGLKEPAWLRQAEEPVPTEVFRAGDLFGDVGAVNLGFTRGGREHTVCCYVADRGGPVLDRVLVVAGSARQLAEEMRAEDEEQGLHVTRLSLEQARTLLAEAIDRLLSEGPDDPEELAELAKEAGLDPEELDMTSPVGLWPLVAVRLDLLPETEPAQTAVGSAEDVHETVAAFLESAPVLAADLDREFAGAMATVMADAAALSDRTAVGFGPQSLGGFLLEEFSESIVLTESELLEARAVITAWAEFTNDRRGFGEEGMRLWREALPQLLETFVEVYDDPEMAEIREEVEAVPVREYQVNAGADLTELLAQLVAEARAAEGFEDRDEDEDEDEER